METNLLITPWLQLKQKKKVDQKKEIPLSEIGDTRFLDVISPRADQKGAIYQLLIGILQSTFAPKNKREWKRYWKEPPTSEVLEAAFSKYHSAFNMFSSNGQPAFMQDFNLPAGETKDVAALFIESPGGKTIKDNQDHFIKRGTINSLAPINAILALFTLQINAPSGGVGHRVSLRGGGPLTTLVLPPAGGQFDTLWHRLWLNVFTQEEMVGFRGNPELEALSDTFPWMAETRTSDSKNKGKETLPLHANPLQMYWSMPRRVRLELETEAEAGICDLTGEATEQCVTHYRAQNYGVNYSGKWAHPLTPYSLQSDDELLSIKAQPGGLGYRHWLGLVMRDESGKSKRHPAQIVQTYLEERYDWICLEDIRDPQIWAFGFDMDNMKARCWYEATMPVFNLVDDLEKDSIQSFVQLMVVAATDTLKTLKTSLKSAWFKRPKDAKGDLSFIDTNFWSATEADFFSCLKQLLNAVRQADDEAVNQRLGVWRSQLKKTAFILFDQYALSSLSEAGDLKKVVKAKHGKGGLEHYLNGSKALKNLTVTGANG